MVGVACLPVGQDDDAGAQTAQDGGDFDAVLEACFRGAVGKVERLAPGDAEEARGFFGFAGAVVGGAAGAGFALGEIEDGGAQAAGGHARSVPPQVCSTSSRWAAMASTSMAGQFGGSVHAGSVDGIVGVGGGVHVGDVPGGAGDGDVLVIDGRAVGGL